MDRKKRVEAAIEGYFKRQEVKEIPPKRTNEKPEKTVEKAVLVWCKQNGFCMDVVESKSKFNTQTMRYTGRAASPGMPDLVGNTSNGLACFIELKAPGCRNGSNLRDNQRDFLTRKIHTNCFAVVTDSVTYLEATWTTYKSLPNKEERIKFLLNELPQHKTRQMKLDL